MVLALLQPDCLRELIIAGGNLVHDDVPLSVGVERPQGPRILHVRGAEVRVLLLDGGQAVHAQVSVQKDVLKEVGRGCIIVRMCGLSCFAFCLTVKTYLSS